MTRTNNLLDLHKERVVRFSNDYKKLFVSYELGRPTGLKAKKLDYHFNSKSIGNGHIVYKDRRLFIEINIGHESLDKLFKIFLVIAYFLGNEIKLYYLYKNFPYYDIPHDFNFDGYTFCFSNQKYLISEAQHAIETGYLLINKDKEFNKILYAILLINTIPEVSIRFFAEYSMLEFLSQKYSKSVKGTIFNKREEKRKLTQFTKNIKQCIQKAEINLPQDMKKNNLLTKKIDEIRKKLDDINNKETWKDRIKNYIVSFDSQHIRSFSQYLEQWSDLRNKKGLAHGNVFHQKIDKNKDSIIMRELHELLAKIIFDKYKKAVLEQKWKE